MTINELLHSLGIDAEPDTQDDKYIIELENSDDFAFVYYKLDKNDDIDLIDLEIDENTINANYMSDEYDITLSADFDKDIYKIIVVEAE